MPEIQKEKKRLPMNGPNVCIRNTLLPSRTEFFPFKVESDEYAWWKHSKPAIENQDPPQGIGSGFTKLFSSTSIHLKKPISS